MCSSMGRATEPQHSRDKDENLILSSERKRRKGKGEGGKGGYESNMNLMHLIKCKLQEIPTLLCFSRNINAEEQRERQRCLFIKS